MSLYKTLKMSLGPTAFSKAQGGFLPHLVVMIGSENQIPIFKKTFLIDDSEMEMLKKSSKPVTKLKSLFVVRPYLNSAFPKNAFAQARESLGMIKPMLDELQQKKIQVHFLECNQDQIDGALIGLLLASYRYKPQISKISYVISPKETTYDKVTAIAESVNLCRHLTNLPSNLLNTKTYSELIAELFKNDRQIQCEVWSVARLKKENMGLLLAVGQSSEHRSTFVHLKYRPKGTKLKPIALVGKGIVFDSGGLDLKSAAGMRIMKKDMSGSAVVVSVLNWAQLSKSPQPLDVYIPLAENSVSSNSFRPGDVLTSRSGQTVEIHNTDAEGRLVLADALDVAVKKTGADQPQCVINVATLTGAIKVGLGSDVAGLFCNDDELAQNLKQASDQVGDPIWRMPLYQKYNNQLNSTVADLVNSSDGFGGAITAALFLEKFVGKTRWAHLDIYGWKDQSDGCLIEPGGSGQAVQTLIQFLINTAGTNSLNRNGDL